MTTQIIYIFKELLLTNLNIFKQTFKDKLIDLIIWITTTVAVSSYILPYFGVNLEYGPFMLAGTCAATGVFEAYGAIVRIMSDLEGEYVLGYYATLPLPTWLVFVQIIIYQALYSLTLALITLPIGNLCLQNPLNLLAINWPAFLILFFITYLFYGAMVLFVTSFIKNMQVIESVWVRIVYPLWFLGGFQFSWYTLFAVSPILAYINLLNPMVYVTEGTRGALLDSADYLPFWLCTLMLILFTLLCALIGIRRLMRRLDLVW